MMFKSLKVFAVAALFSASLPLAGQAADIAPVPDTSDWKFTAAAYVWGAGLSGDVGAPDRARARRGGDAPARCRLRGRVTQKPHTSH